LAKASVPVVVPETPAKSPDVTLTTPVPLPVKAKLIFVSEPLAWIVGAFKVADGLTWT
jgi:hypothetical protein